MSQVTKSLIVKFISLLFFSLFIIAAKFISWKKCVKMGWLKNEKIAFCAPKEVATSNDVYERDR